MALRLSREQAAVDLPKTDDPDLVISLPSVRAALGGASESSATQPPEAAVAETGDDDETDLDGLGEDDFYADALEDV
jgi:hypothetical protein